jgi:predicted O-methyltransferase YrrM
MGGRCQAPAGRIAIWTRNTRPWRTGLCENTPKICNMKFSRILLPPPFEARHYKRTFIASPDDEKSRPNRDLIECALDVARKTMDIDISDVCGRLPGADWDPALWPGEHYRLLAGLVARLQPRTVVEIGTETGLSALCLLKYLPVGGRLVTFDVIPWCDIPKSCLTAKDFSDGRLKQEVADLSIPDVFGKHASLLAEADLIFADGPKDGVFEYKFIDLLDTLTFAKPPYVVFDDIRDRNMLRFWREMNKPKLDISSFGHWTGTGLVMWEKTVNPATRV